MIVNYNFVKSFLLFNSVYVHEGEFLMLWWFCKHFFVCRKIE
jgi:hypothetical protein